MADPTTPYPYGFREVPVCNCGQLFNTPSALNQHISKLVDDVTQWPSGNRGHGNMTQRIAVTQAEHDAEQIAVERLQRSRHR